MNYQASALQDRFVDLVLKNKRDGHFVDIGSCDAVSCNNTYCFEEIGWKGICIEMDARHNDSYAKRNCKYVNADATKIDYAQLFRENNMPALMDYLSLDVDEASTEVLRRLPLKEYNFRVITIEHDYYIHGHAYMIEQRQILFDAGYHLLCASVLVPIQHDTNPNCSFEDWWVKDEPLHLMNWQYPHRVIERLKSL